MIKYLKFLTACVGFIALVQCAEPLASKIIGGKNAELTPYQISLQYFAPTQGFWFLVPAKNYSHFCGGSIINELFILTAAHCVKDMPLEKLSVIAGIKNLKESNTVTRHLLEYYKIHPDYMQFNSSDIAIARLKVKFIFSATIAPVTLGIIEVAAGQNCKLTGWGYTNPFGILPPDDLQEGTFTTMTLEECQKSGMPAGPKDLCVTSGFSKGACAGDSGGPLYCNGVLAGITSYGFRICAFGKPDVFTRVSKFVDWIVLNTISI